MEIKTIDDTVINTDKLSDKDAEISEALNKLYEVCEKYNVTLFTKVILSNKNYLGAFHLVKGDKDKQSSDVYYLLNLINDDVIKATQGQVRFMRVQEIESEENNQKNS